jgi:mono/diheme cytochrome c family protein
MRSVLVAIAVVIGVLFVARPTLHALETLTTGSPCSDALPVPPELRLPAVVPPGEPVAIERTVLGYLSAYKYRALGWCEDKGVRDTGPYINHVSYGTHPAVRIYYSPEMMDWLRNGRRGVPRDGAVIIKEQYGDKPAEYFKNTPAADLQPTDWTFMIRRSSASHDGWFWGEVYVGMFANAKPAAAAAVSYPFAGFGIYCLRCHASAQSAMTFSSLENIAGFPGKPLTYEIDNSWRTQLAAAPQAPATPSGARALPVPVQTFPPEPLDTYVAHAHVPHMFLTSNQCENCHGASPGKPFGPVMWVSPAPPHAKQSGLNVSEYGEWRWSPMALAGRDPVFYAQLESEMTYLATIHDGRISTQLQHKVINICMTCHGAMGKRTLDAAHPGATFATSIVFNADPASSTFHEGGLARDGISCAVCHHVVAPKAPRGTTTLAYFLNNRINGDLDFGPADQMYGPFESDTISTHPMKEALGVTPRHSSYIASSELCGSCHTINLPVVDHGAPSVAPSEHNVEQATYLEWLNSSYQTDYHPGAGARSCQSCHMPQGVTDPARGVALSHIVSKIAFAEDDSYPETTHAAPPADIKIRVRKTGFSRHEMLGLNAFLLEMFREYPQVMGVRTTDYMSGSTNDIEVAIANAIAQARTSSATVRVRDAHVTSGKLIADVVVKNLTGHRFPTGVSFRRAFIDFEVRDATAPSGAPPLFASGRTDARGRIVGADGKPLATESFAPDAHGHQRYQPHFDEAFPITRPDQVQIFEELTTDADGKITTSFIRRDHALKDNRLLPLGWSRTGPTPTLPAYFLEATYPHGGASTDPRYLDGRGHAVVRYAIVLPRGVNTAHLRITATLYYESFTPQFLRDRSSGTGTASVRLKVIVSNLDVANTALRDWKIRIGADSVALP